MADPVNLLVIAVFAICLIAMPHVNEYIHKTFLSSTMDESNVNALNVTVPWKHKEVGLSESWYDIKDANYKQSPKESDAYLQMLCRRRRRSNQTYHYCFEKLLFGYKWGTPKKVSKPKFCLDNEGCLVSSTNNATVSPRFSVVSGKPNFDWKRAVIIVSHKKATNNTVKSYPKILNTNGPGFFAMEFKPLIWYVQSDIFYYSSSRSQPNKITVEMELPMKATETRANGVYSILRL